MVFFFNTPSDVSRVKIRISNNGRGGTGNDLAIDDITFRACGTKINSYISNTSETTKTICKGENIQFDFCCRRRIIRCEMPLAEKTAVRDGKTSALIILKKFLLISVLSKPGYIDSEWLLLYLVNSVLLPAA